MHLSAEPSYMHDSCVCMYTMAHCVCSVSGVLNYVHAYLAPEHVYGTVQYVVQVSLELVHDLGVGEGTWLCHYTN